MKITCPNCSLSKDVDDSRIPEGPSSVTCPRCHTRFSVRMEDAEDLQREGVAPKKVCPSCAFTISTDDAKTESCPRCGLIFSKRRERPHTSVEATNKADTLGDIAVPLYASRSRLVWSITYKLLLPLAILLMATILYHQPSLSRRSLFYLTSLLHKAPPNDYWAKTTGFFNADFRVSSAAALTDNSIIMVGAAGATGTPVIAKMNPAGSLLWSKTCFFAEKLSPTKVFAAADGGLFAAFSSTGAASIGKFSSNGAMLWHVDLADIDVRDISPTSDGGILFAGAQGHATGDGRICTGKLDGDGRITWYRVSGPGVGTSCVETAGRGSLVSAITHLSHPVVCMLNPVGEPMWQKELNYRVNSTFLQASPNGGAFVIVNTGWEPLVLSFNATGDLTWSNWYKKNAVQCRFSSLTDGGDGFLYVSGEGRYNGRCSVLLLKIDHSTGAVLWETALPLTGMVGPSRASHAVTVKTLKSPDSFYVVGSTSDFGLHWKGLLLKMDKNGNMPIGKKDYMQPKFAVTASYDRGIYCFDSSAFSGRQAVADVTFGSYTSYGSSMYVHDVLPPAPTIDTFVTTEAVINKVEGSYAQYGIRTVNVYNNGAEDLHISKIFFEGDDSSFFHLTNAVSTIKRNTGFRLRIKTTGYGKHVNLVIYSNDPKRPVHMQRIDSVGRK